MIRFKIKLSFTKVNGDVIAGDDTRIQLESGTTGTLHLSFKLVQGELATGESIELRRYCFQAAHRLQNTHPERRDYVTFETTSDADIELRLPPWDIKGLALNVKQGKMIPGDEIIIRIGDRSAGSVGSEVFWSATRGRLTLMTKDTECAESISDDYYIDITSRSTPKCLRLLGPTVVAKDEPFSMSMVVYDINRNPIESFTGKVLLDPPQGIASCPREITFTPADKGIAHIDSLSASEPGVHRISAILADSELKTTSNPIICELNPSRKIYWGDLHTHGWGDCSMLLMHDRNWKFDPDARHTQAQDIGRYDYSAPGAMSMPHDETREDIWNAYLDAFDKHDAPGTYVPFMAMEMHPREGDRTMIFRDRENTITALPSIGTDVEKLYKQYGSRDDVMLETHIGGAPPYFENHRFSEEKLVEVVSSFGNAEWLLQKMLNEGYHPAITGASDLHAGTLGAPRAVETFRGRFNKKLNIRDCGFGSGPIGAIIADKCERNQLWNSLRNRRGYATSGDRIYLKLDAGGYEMGKIAPLADIFELSLRIHGQTDIEKIDLIVGDKLAKTWLNETADVNIQLLFDRNAMPPGNWFYFRIKQTNAEYAWTTPVWFSDKRTIGNQEVDWKSWNHAEAPAPVSSLETDRHLKDLLDYLDCEGDRKLFDEITPTGVFEESMGTSCQFISTILPERYPVTIRWFFEYEIPKIRVDYGYENFGVVDCHKGPVGQSAVGNEEGGVSRN